MATYYVRKKKNCDNKNKCHETDDVFKVDQGVENEIEQEGKQKAKAKSDQSGASVAISEEGAAVSVYVPVNVQVAAQIAGQGALPITNDPDMAEVEDNKLSSIDDNSCTNSNPFVIDTGSGIRLEIGPNGVLLNDNKIDS
ncbi:MAG: hypothetical protein ACOCZ5_02680 [bacterium]